MYDMSKLKCKANMQSPFGEKTTLYSKRNKNVRFAFLEYLLAFKTLHISYLWMKVFAFSNPGKVCPVQSVWFAMQCMPLYFSIILVSHFIKFVCNCFCLNITVLFAIFIWILLGCIICRPRKEWCAFSWCCSSTGLL